jgi:hypothetical protein
VNTNVSYLGVTAQTTPGPWTAVELGTMNFARVGDQYFVNFSPSVIPVPAALPLMLSGLIALGAIARRRTQAMAV